jgi:hypothetical protein
VGWFNQSQSWSSPADTCVGGAGGATGSDRSLVGVVLVGCMMAAGGCPCVAGRTNGSLMANISADPSGTTVINTYREVKKRYEGIS